jgi:glycosyltransferase involved in cell wall biosynthesis
MTVAMVETGVQPISISVREERSISVIVTAMNEEGNLIPAVDAVVRAVSPRFFKYEIIIIDDGSQDRTFEVAQGLSAGNPRIRVHRNPRNLGLGSSYRIGVELARNEYLSWVAGNNFLPAEALQRVYDRVGESDMVISYILCDVRRLSRRLVSRAFTFCMNVLFGVRVRYYTGPCVYKTEVARRTRARAQGSMFVAEILLRLLKSGQSYVEVGLQPLPRSTGSTKTFRLKNILDVVCSAISLFWELRVRRHVVLASQPDLHLVDSDPPARSHDLPFRST